MKKSLILRKYGKISDLESLFTFMQNQQFKKKTCMYVSKFKHQQGKYSIVKNTLNVPGPAPKAPSINLFHLICSWKKMNDTQNIPDPKLLFASDNEKTFSSDESLPSLPVPDLQHTLQRYLDSGAYTFILNIGFGMCKWKRKKMPFYKSFKFNIFKI